MLNCHSSLQDNSEENQSSKGSKGPLSEGEPRNSQKRLCSCIISGSICDSKCTQKFSLSLLTGLNSSREQDLVSPSSGGDERGCDLKDSDSSDLVKLSLEEVATPKDISLIPSVNAVSTSKLSSSLITFQRRAKRDKDAGRAYAKGNLEAEDVACLSVENTACLVAPHDSDKSVAKSCSVDLSADFKHPEVNPYPRQATSLLVMKRTFVT